MIGSVVTAAGAGGGFGRLRQADDAGGPGKPCWLLGAHRPLRQIFHNDGVFDYLYFATLRMHWELGNQGEIKLSSVDGGVRWSCWYTLVDGLLRVDNGKGETCVCRRGKSEDADAVGDSVRVSR